jgi:hypothetical protein
LIRRILVLETNGGLLHLFSSVREAETHLETIDIENGEYEFCDDSGQGLVGEIVTRVSFFRAGSFRLRPDGAPDRAVLDSVLSRACSLERQCEGITTIDDLRRRYAA